MTIDRPSDSRTARRHVMMGTDNGGKRMLSWQIGDVKVSRVVEMEIPVPYN